MPRIRNQPPLPKNLKVVELEEVTLDGSTQTVAVSCRIEHDGIEIDHQFNLDPQTDPELHKTLESLTDVILRRAYKPNKAKRRLKCEACTSACCHVHTQVLLFRSDIPGLCKATGLTTEKALRKAGVIVGKATLGGVGYLGRVDMRKTEELSSDDACVFVSWNERGVGRCLIYENRPYTCRSYEERTCGSQEKPNKKLYAIRPFKKYAKNQKINPSKKFNLEAFTAENPGG